MPDVFGMTDRGQVRPTNEDQFVVAELNRALVVHHSSFPASQGECICDAAQGLVLGVADGVASRGAGKLASAVALDALCAYALRLMPWIVPAHADAELGLAPEFEAAVHEAEARMQRVAMRKEQDPGLATTLTLAYVVWPKVFVVHVGKSRAYKANAQQLRCITRDHSIPLAGRSEPEVSSNRRVALVNALGGGNGMLHVDVSESSLEQGDGLLVVTDGVLCHVEERELAEIVLDGEDAETTVKCIVERANARGGEDNITAVFARF